MVKEPQVWRAPGDIEQSRSAGANAVGPASARHRAAEDPPRRSGRSARAARHDPPAGPAHAAAVEELPLVAQNEIKAAQAGGTPRRELRAQKPKVGFLERLAGVRHAPGRTEADASGKA